MITIPAVKLWLNQGKPWLSRGKLGKRIIFEQRTEKNCYESRSEWTVFSSPLYLYHFHFISRSRENVRLYRIFTDRCSYTLFYKKVVYKKVILEWPKPWESLSTSSKMLRKFLKIFMLNRTSVSVNCLVSPLMIWLSLRLLKSFLNHDNVRIFSLVCYFPPHYQNNKKQPVNLRKS